MMRRSARLSALTAACLLTGCGGMTVAGKVLPGEISYVGIVDHSDTRLKELGVGQVSLHIEPPVGSGSGAIATATSKPDGSFKITIPTETWSTDRVQVRAMIDGYATARGLVYLPREGQSLLILMERTSHD
ncbi:MAG: hypothetical protein DYG94_07575 [Leptolyngbya sp. PLA3]|nr:MAG: hypothetical protein EDM82_10520 [Cyanobacteria bacterium CYA]MCE7968590.1 hypothetical protein [Leptolyngbya sp. PL-A3]